jgi:hypothetical protein
MRRAANLSPIRFCALLHSSAYHLRDVWPSRIRRMVSVQPMRAGMMPVMVPDILAPTEEIRAMCVHIALDLHEVRALLAKQSVP